ncbi:tetratricopeptide repeat protein, partial [Actinophytocola sp.]|uniref:tetratricopeptide repeat protein n=1 Tax=Actinophytocola sp. TaxID=1872138 RepID=UPI002EDA9B4B
ELAEQALTLWRGRPLADLASDRADAWRTRFVQNSWLPANFALLEALLATHRYDDALERLDELQADHPHDLSLAMLRLTTLHHVARGGEATAYYLGMRRHFVTEFDQQAADHLMAHYNGLFAPSLDLGHQPEPVVRPRQLPHDIADFAGREDLLAALDRATTTADGEATSGVVILDGMAGVGKTALAVRWGHRARNRFPDGELCVNLNGFGDAARVEPSTVVDDFLIALGHESDPRMEHRSRELLLRRVLAGRRMLVILDNVRDTAHVAGLVRLLSNCLVLVTSRLRLGSLAAATGARRVRVEPMTPDEGVDLLSRRLGGPARLDQDRREQVIALCAGLPLAITLLADHVARAPAAELSGFVDSLDRRQLITDIGEHGDGVAKVRAFFSQSYLALGPAERRLFRLIALHPGPDISIDAACACDGRTRSDTTNSLNVLVGSHVLEQPETLDRFRFHDLIGEFATECAELDESPESRSAADHRILTFYLTTARDAVGALYPSLPLAPPPEGLPAVTAAPLADVAAARGWFDRERTTLTAAIGYALDQGFAELVWQLADPVTTYFDRKGYFASSCALRELAVTAARVSGHRLAEGSTLLGLGMVRLTLGEHAAARRRLAEAMPLFEAEGNDRGVAATLHQQGKVEIVRGDPAAGLDLYLRSLAIVRRIADQEAECWVRLSLGEAYRTIEQHGEALVHLHEAKWLAQRIGDDPALGSSLAMIGAAHRDLGDLQAAAAHTEQALAIVEDVDLGVTAKVCIELAELAEARGDPATAVGYARRAVAVCRQMRNVVYEAQADEVLGDVRYANADLPDAVAAWQDAADLCARLGDPTRAALIQAKIDKVPAHDIQLPRARPGTLPAPDRRP